MPEVLYFCNDKQLIMSDISIWQFPLSLILALTFLAGLFLLWKYLPEGGVRRFLSGKFFCALTIIAVTVMTAIEGTWGTRMHRSPLLWAVSLLMMVSLGFAVLNGTGRKRRLPHLLSHAGMFLMAFGAFWGAPDFTDVQLVAEKGRTENQAFTRDGMTFTLPFSVSLDDFTTEYYSDGTSPEQYISTLDIDGKKLVTSVNHPCRHKGYLIYQYDYDHVNGSYSVLKMVRDPWLSIVFTGLLMLMAGAIVRLRLDWKSKYLTIAVAVTAILFAIISVARINFSTLMPALRSLWFVPHLVMYMLAYSSLAIALIFGVLSICGVRAEKFKDLSSRLFDTASSLLLIGMICGAFWAKAAWGDWWTWDAKECWAAVTWLLTILGTHLPKKITKKGIAVLICMLLSFVAMQVAWYGVESLPASRTSMHTYK